MKHLLRPVLFILILASAFTASAQPNYSTQSVFRITKLRIVPGKNNEFYKALAWGPKVWEAEKAAGLIVDYGLMHSVNYEGPDKYDVILWVQFKNMAALDSFADAAEPVIAKVYGTPAQRADVLKMRDESSETVSSELTRGMKLK